MQHGGGAMTWIMSVARAHPVAAYFSIGVFLSVALGTWMAWTFDGDLGNFCLFLCGMALVAWPIMAVIAALAIPVALLEALGEWFDKTGFKPLTWVFAWPWKLWALANDRRYRRKDGKAGEMTGERKRK